MRWFVRALCAMSVAVSGSLAQGAAAHADSPGLDGAVRTLAVIHASQSPAHKSGPDNTTSAWANNSMTGYCGQVDGGYPVAAQLFLYADGRYAGPIDNYWGSHSHSALIAYQRSRGTLQPDGCAGPKTWADMQARTRYVGSSSECVGSGSLAVIQYTRSGRSAFFDQSTRTRYWFADTYLQPDGGPVGEHLYRFSDDLHSYC